MKKFYNKELKSAGFRIKSGMTRSEEQGRSMVEMLGVLAVMGVLSVGGVAMYTSAMNKHRANELLNEASKRAAVVAVQAMQGRETLSISEFGTENTRLNFSETVHHDTTNNQFTLTITGVAEAVCQQMSNAKGPVIRKFEPATCSDNVTVKLTFNDDMSTTPKASDFNGDPDHCPGKYCTGSNTCVNTGASCTCSGTVPACKECDTTTGSYVNATDNISCITAANKYGTCQSGTCVQITLYLGAQGVWNELNNMSATTRCPKGGNWLTREDLSRRFGCPTSGYCSDWPDGIAEAGWSATDTGNSAYFVSRDGYVMTMTKDGSSNGSYGTGYALCYVL